MAANARVHASVLDLYDNARLAQPTKANMPISWFGFEYETKAKLDEISRTSITLDENDDMKIRKNNSFLHDNVD